MNCKEARQLISPYLDGMLEGQERMTVRQHLDHCSLCRENYRDLSQLSGMLRSMGKDIKPAPAGFADTVMLAVREDARLNKPNRFGSLGRYWKRVVPAAAAAVLLVFYAIQGIPGVSNTVTQIAERNGAGQAQNPPYVAENPSPAPAAPPSKDPGNPISAPQVTATADPGSDTPSHATSTPVLLSAENRNILTTMLIIDSSKDSGEVDTQVGKIAAEYSAVSERLGQQVKAGVTYSLMKITVDRNQGESLISRLNTVGTVVSRQEDRQDISQAYTQALEQFLSLSTRLGAAKDPAEIKLLEQQVNGLQKQLGVWNQKAGVQTIVLWITD